MKDVGQREENAIVEVTATVVAEEVVIVAVVVLLEDLLVEDLDNNIYQYNKSQFN